MEIVKHVRDGEIRLALCGELDMATATLLRLAVNDALVSRPARLVVDLESLVFCDSTGISALLAVNKAARASGVALRVSDANGPSVAFWR